MLACECVCSTWLWLFSRPYGSCWVSACLSCSLWPDGPQHCSMARSSRSNTRLGLVSRIRHTPTQCLVSLSLYPSVPKWFRKCSCSITILCASNHIYMFGGVFAKWIKITIKSLSCHQNHLIINNILQNNLIQY